MESIDPGAQIVPTRSGFSGLSGCRILRPMARRLLVKTLRTGPNPLPPDQAHHARDVLRLGEGDAVELFTAAGQVAAGVVAQVSAAAVVVRVDEISQARASFALTIASAVPKAARADWMVEKLSELGVSRFVPLITARSVVHPEGKNKIDRWQRLAAESAKQCHRPGVMKIAPLTPLADVVTHLTGPAGYLSTAADASPLAPTLQNASKSLTLLVGPEGGWSAEEIAAFAERHLTPITLGGTILRVETAAIAAAAVVAALTPFADRPPTDPNPAKHT
jgi:16S rRNA (uracil1498-N3)-methyltransferase